MQEREPFEIDSTHELAFRIAYLIAGFIKDDLTEAEHLELDDWVCEKLENQAIFERMTDPSKLQKWKQWLIEHPTDKAWKSLKSKIDFGPGTKTSKFHGFLNCAAAACFLLLFGYLQWKYWNSAAPISTALTVDLPTGVNHAYLQLADGTDIVLDTISKGLIDRKNGLQIHRINSSFVSFQSSNTVFNKGPESINKITVPLGATFQIALPDGSHVWLNAGSSLLFPSIFLGSKRSVALTGEAYFEVAKKTGMPFEVKASNAVIKVLGTHFNVNAYTGESVVKITIKEGAVTVNDKVLLQPEYLALVSPTGSIEILPANTDKELAWTHGLFVFTNADIESLMRELCRWYNCEVVYKSKITHHFNGSFSRKLPASKILEVLEQTGTVHFKIENKKIIVMYSKIYLGKTKPGSACDTARILLS